MDRLINWVRRRSQPSEAAGEYDGVLSHVTEVHALLIGLASGFAAGVAGSPEMAAAVAAAAIGIQIPGLTAAKFRGKKALREIRKEPWYAVGGTPIGYLVAMVATSLPGLL
ncbi:hypothetical protein [Halostella sp. PRR32]|uniref:hypothetical protein n=1 Tax=Halostella sp. PRR32 TaxID=3098147 RepID=UPI002B1D1574|nr:hypothetical protein [Halostella sp. PRR32]